MLLLIAASACSKDETPTAPTTPSCTITAGSISASTFGAAGGTATVPVTAGTGCTWTATSSATFVTITAGATGSGSGTVTATVAANTGAARSATLTIAGTTFTISQSAATTGTPGTLSAPTASSPVGGQLVTDVRPPLVVNNATPAGTLGAVTYRFEISDQPTFPNDAARTFSVDGVTQGAGSTTGIVNRDLGPDVLWYWHARATDGTVTSAYSATETFRTGSTCAFSVSPANASVSSSGGTVIITVTTSGACSWTATSNAAFIAVSAGASGTGSGTVTATVAPGAGTPRSGTLTVAGQTVTIDQGSAAGISASFQMFDPGLGPSPTTECRITSGIATVCQLNSTSFPLGANGLSTFAWTVQWTDGSAISRTQTGASPTFSFTWTCGGPNSTAEGAAQPLAVTLTVTDTSGNSATVTSGSGSQPPLFLRLFKC
ncbi:MAG: BACON domain-containing protein [Vicinamibacterales bacterium]